MLNRNLFTVILVLLIFFVISFLTNILGALNPAIKESFHLEYSSLGFMTLAFFSAYGVMSIPSGFLVERYKEKRVILMAFILAGTGALIFSLKPTFLIFLGSLFAIGTGMAMLQVAINPLLREAGGEEHFAFNSVLGQLFFGVAGVAGPYFFSYLMENIDKKDVGFVVETLSDLSNIDMKWTSLYWVFAFICILMVLVVLFHKFPIIEKKEDERIGTLIQYKQLFKNPIVISFFIGIFCYVGFEQGVSFWISQFLSQYHDVDPNAQGAETVGNFWGLLTLGCFLGLLLLKFIDSKKVLLLFSSLAFISLTLALFGPLRIALFAFPAVGFFASVMWSVIFSLGLNSLKFNHGAMAGILCTGIVGGAVAPFIIGGISDFIGLKFGMLFNYLLLAYIFSIGLWANPIVKNRVIKIKNN
ncbi:MAG: MFS transporter [Flavobacteriaceae bacterium]|nr:MFS transporter [Flavobacteriaceae bacterium]